MLTLLGSHSSILWNIQNINLNNSYPYIKIQDLVRLFLTVWKVTSGRIRRLIFSLLNFYRNGWFFQRLLGYLRHFLITFFNIRLMIVQGILFTRFWLCFGVYISLRIGKISLNGLKLKRFQGIMISYGLSIRILLLKMG